MRNLNIFLQFLVKHFEQLNFLLKRVSSQNNKNIAEKKDIINTKGCIFPKKVVSSLKLW